MTDRIAHDQNMKYLPPGLNKFAVIARNLHPGIWSEDGVEYCREIADQRCEARRAAATAIKNRPVWAHAIIDRYRRNACR